jgi:hypothetical protein
MSFKFQDCTEEDLWKFVATHLKEKGIDTILVGKIFQLLPMNGKLMAR